MFNRRLVLSLVALLSSVSTVPSLGLEVQVAISRPQSGAFPLVEGEQAAPLFVDAADYPAVLRAAEDLQQDIDRVTGITPKLKIGGAPSGRTAVIAGTLGTNSLIDELVQVGAIDTRPIAGKWEAFLIATLENPLPGVAQALVIVGSDRRGTIYGLYELSEQIGVSPWYWWADVPIEHRNRLFIKPGCYVEGPPAVKYRGIFINDEDWGLHQWAMRTFEPEAKGIGPKTYAKVFELMLRLRLNYIWPAMHECSQEFAANPKNVELADRYGIVAGASHCEPMLFNNAKWDESELGKWDYTQNRDTMLAAWEGYAKARGDKEAVWPLGIRGIHDTGMQGAQEVSARIEILEKVVEDQRKLIDQYVTRDWGPVAQAFVPYKEVLELYDAGLQVPEDVTLVWVDDNFGYIRRLSTPAERRRSGGAGVYYHLSYYGGPHSYLWLNTTAPALMWEELHKAWENDARTIWLLNVGDIKPMEIGIDYFAKFAWNPEKFGPDSQPRFLHSFAARLFGDELAKPIAELLHEYYRLGTIRKPELMSRPSWALLLPEEEAVKLRGAYRKLLDDESQIAAQTPPESQDAYDEMIGFPARVLAASGLIFMADRAIQYGDDMAANQKEVQRLRQFIDDEVRKYNNDLAAGKWRYMMPGAVTAEDLTQWNSQVRWPWGDSQQHPAPASVRRLASAREWRAAASAYRQSGAGEAKWMRVEGLGTTGKALALKPARVDFSWHEGDDDAPTLEYDFRTDGGPVELLIDFLPTFRICPGLKLRVAVSTDDQPAQLVEIPGSSGAEDEYGRTRSSAVQSNYVRAQVSLGELTEGRHVLKIRAVDPGVAIDRLSLP